MLKVTMRFMIGELWIALSLGAIFLSNYIIYYQQILDTYSYYGAHSWRIVDVGFFIIFALTSYVLLPRRIETPIDVFGLVYIILVLFGTGSYLQTLRLFSSSDILILYFLLTFPIILLIACRHLTWKSLGLFLLDAGQRRDSIAGLVVILLLVTLALILTEWPLSLNFGDIYTIRADGKLSWFGLTPYITGALASAFIPFISFLAGFNKKKLLLVVGVVLALCMLFVAGVKGQFAYLIFSYSLGWLLGSGRCASVYKYMLLATLLLFAVVLIEGFPSVIAEYVSRRVFVVPGVGVAAHLELINYTYPEVFSPLYGMAIEGSVNHLVGVDVMGFHEDLNVNANTVGYLHGFVTGGLIHYVGATCISLLYFCVLNIFYKITNDPVYIAASASFTFAIVEQSVFTAMLSSGMAVLFILTVFRNLRFRRLELLKPLRA